MIRETSDFMVTQSIGLQSLCGLDAALSPRTPREPVPSVPPIGQADGAPLRYGGSKAASRSAQ